jgi:hypothetical protein
MENHISVMNDENVKLVNPYIVTNFEDLSKAIVLQKNENEHM